MAQGYTEKHQEFVGEPMGNKPLEKVPGIGKALADSMRSPFNPTTVSGRPTILTAKQLYGYYLINPGAFTGLVKSYGANVGQQQRAYDAMRGWDQQHN